jgi:hypothetical protein
VGRLEALQLRFYHVCTLNILRDQAQVILVLRVTIQKLLHGNRTFVHNKNPKKSISNDE